MTRILKLLWKYPGDFSIQGIRMIPCKPRDIFTIVHPQCIFEKRGQNGEKNQRTTKFYNEIMKFYYVRKVRFILRKELNFNQIKS